MCFSREKIQILCQNAYEKRENATVMMTIAFPKVTPVGSDS